MAKLAKVEVKQKVLAAFKTSDPSGIGLISLAEVLRLITGVAPDLLAADILCLVLESNEGIVRYASFLDHVFTESSLVTGPRLAEGSKLAAAGESGQRLPLYF